MNIVKMTRKHAENLKPVMTYAINYQEGIDSLISEFDPVMPVIINRTTIRVLNPVILTAYLKNSTLEHIPALVVNLPAEDEILLSIAINGGLDHFLHPTPTNIETVINAIIAATPEKNAAIAPVEYIADLLDRFASDSDEQPAGEADEQPPAIETMPQIDPVQNDYDIPMLDINRQLLEPPASAAWVGWGMTRQTDYKEAVHFYVDDNKFSALESDPTRLYKSKPRAAIECNYSTEEDRPRALVIADVWRKRMLSRIWQNNGIEIAVDLNVDPKFFNINLLGVPSGWRSYANRAYTNDMSHLETAYKIAQQHAGTDDIIYIVYGRQTAKTLCSRHGWGWIDSSQYTFNQ